MKKPKPIPPLAATISLNLMLRKWFGKSRNSDSQELSSFCTISGALDPYFLIRSPLFHLDRHQLSLSSALPPEFRGFSSPIQGGRGRSGILAALPRRGVSLSVGAHGGGC
ncbi:1-phosphatidylinositol 4,5-bisphosphate phosphodiesterase gamma-2 [Striga asiatica]|uniref:1-phosphatidylinositol 4,5-bisphosphate phosphodiesterase gamma-2 n=1 Tax=Striga asiatica TaxID=4170 RepID=A0A5A7QHN3_STRAF|nr:1-phosphatidylinositol 4,5-bisphosphate phosphodiesterase gamma-2 [Striga asiatica]